MGEWVTLINFFLQSCYSVYILLVVFPSYSYSDVLTTAIRVLQSLKSINMPGELFGRMTISSTEEKLSSLKPEMDLYLIVSHCFTTFPIQPLINPDRLLTMWSMSKISYAIQETLSHGLSISITSINMALFSNKHL